MTNLGDIRAIKGLKFCHLNVRSIVNKIDLFRLHFSDSDIDIITVSESWLTPDINTSIINMDGYQLYRTDRSGNNLNCPVNKKGGGLLVFIKNNLNFTVESDPGRCTQCLPPTKW